MHVKYDTKDKFQVFDETLFLCPFSLNKYHFLLYNFLVFSGGFKASIYETC